MEGESVHRHVEVKEYSSVLLEGLPRGWYEQPEVTGGPAVGAATKHDIFGSGVSVLEESCCHSEDRTAIMKISCLPGTTINCTLPGVKPSVIYKESAVLSMTLEDLYYVNILKQTCVDYGVCHTRKNTNVFIIEGPMDRLVDFRRAFDRAVLSCRATSGPVSLSAVASSISEQPSNKVSHHSTLEKPSLNEFFPPSMFDAFTNLHQDVLAILQKIPAGKIPGIHYKPKTGTIYIDKEADRDAAIASFQKEYQNVIDGRKLKVDTITVASEMPDTAISAISADFNDRYSQCVFSFERDSGIMKIVSVSSRQLDQARKQLAECFLTTGSCFVPIDEHGRVLTLKKSNIVLEEVDIIVNAANGALRHGGGVALAIDRASAGAVQKQCDKIMKSRGKRGDYKVGHVVASGAGGALKCKHIIHAVGPTKDHHSPGETLKSLLINVLREAQRLKAKSIAIPAISAGLFSVDSDLVAKSLLDVILHVYKYPHKSVLVSDIRIVIIDQPTYQCFFDYLRHQKLVSPPSKKHSLKEDTLPAKDEAGLKDDSSAVDNSSAVPSALPEYVSDNISDNLSAVARENSNLSAVSPEPSDSMSALSDYMSAATRDHPTSEHSDNVPAVEDSGFNKSEATESHKHSVSHSDSLSHEHLAEREIPPPPVSAISVQSPSTVSTEAHDISKFEDEGKEEEYSRDEISTELPSVYTDGRKCDYSVSENAGDHEESTSVVDGKGLTETDAPNLATVDAFPRSDETTVCDKVIEIMVPIAFKWRMLAKYLKFPTNMVERIASANESDARKLEVLVREWWQMKKGEDRGLLLCSILHHNMKEEQTARQVWKLDVFTSWPKSEPVDLTTRSSNNKVKDGAPNTGVRPDAYLVDFSLSEEEDTDNEAVGHPPTCLDGSIPPPPLVSPTSPAVMLSPKSPVIYSRSCSLVHPSNNPFEDPEFVDSTASQYGMSENQERSWPDLSSVTSRSSAAAQDTMKLHHSAHAAPLPPETGSKKPTSPVPPSPPPYSGHMMVQRAASTPTAPQDGAESTVSETPTTPPPPRSHSPKKRKSPSGSSKKSSPKRSSSTKRVCGICKKDIKVVGRALCGHRFCKDCILNHFHQSPCCPVCNVVVQPLQPAGGTMARNISKDLEVPGYEGAPTIVIEYDIPGGTQGQWHPNPGRAFEGVTKTAYVPCTSEGEEVVRLLRKAFEGRWLFTIAKHSGTNRADAVDWSDVEHKTSLSSGEHGYPDPHYLARVKKQLASKGITS